MEQSTVFKVNGKVVTEKEGRLMFDKGHWVETIYTRPFLQEKQEEKK